MKLKELYNKYRDWVVVILLLLFAFKGCQSCSRGRMIEYNQNQHEQSKVELVGSIDSLNNIIQIKNHQIDSLNISKKQYIDSLNTVIVNKDFQIDILNNELKDLKESVRHYRSTNATLINTNRELSNKTE